MLEKKQIIIIILYIFFFADLAAIRRLLDTENTAGTCPSCDMPFDKGKKRRLIDNCGHERCYSCMFTNEVCPLCSSDIPIDQIGKYYYIQRDQQ